MASENLAISHKYMKLWENVSPVTDEIQGITIATGS